MASVAVYSSTSLYELHDRRRLDRVQATVALMITISGLSWAKRHKRKFDAVLSIEDPDAETKYRLRFHRNPRPEHLVLRFIDLDTPVPMPYSEHYNARMASETDIEEALDFGRQHENLLIHCHAGVARSTGIGLAILAERLGKGGEEEALRMLLDIRPIAVPNLHVVTLADKVLDRSGRLLEVLQTWDITLAENAQVRHDKRKAYFFYLMIPPAAEPDLFRATDLDSWYRPA